MAKAAPRMIADAPGGWSSFGIGRAFTYWYQPIGMVLMSGSLINSHLTLLAGFGIAGRFFYLFSLFVVLALSLLLIVASCGILPPRGATVITGHEEMMAILQEHFPDLYTLHEQERIEVDEIYFYTTRRGEPKYKVSFRYMPPHAH